jgi:hypothetical protein
MDRVHPDLRPDRCNVVFEKLAPNVILGSSNIMLEEVSVLVYQQIDFFLREGISVVLQQFNPFNFKGFLAVGMKREEVIKVLGEKANDCAKLY